MTARLIGQLEREETALATKVAAYRLLGYHCSADHLEDRLERLRWRLGVARGKAAGAFRDVELGGKVLVTPSKTSRFRDSGSEALT